VAHFLNYPFAVPAQPVAHDVAPLCRSVDNFLHAYKEEGMWGAVEMGGAAGWQIIRKEMPELKTVLIRRPLQDVYESIANMGYLTNLTNLAELNATLDLIAQQPNVYSINMGDLDAPVTCKWLFEYCLELEFDFDWWYKVSQVNIQVDVDSLIAMKDDILARHDAYMADVKERMKEIKTCLH